MTLSVPSILYTNALECLSIVWIELSLALLACLTYVMISRTSRDSPQIVAKACYPEGSPKFATKAPCSSVDHQELTTSQLANNALRQGNMKQAIGLIRQLPGGESGRVPANMAFRLLMAAAKVKKFDEMLSELVVLKDRVANGPLEAAISDSLKKGNTDACRRLHVISNLLSIPKSQQTYQTLATAYSSDAASLRKLVQEAEKPLSRPFAKIVLDACAALKESDLAAEVLEKASSRDVGLRNSWAVPSAGSSENTLVDKAASKCNKAATFDHLDVPRDVSLRSNDIRSCGRNGDLTNALKIFDKLDQVTANYPLVMTSVIDACVKCNDIEKAVTYFNLATSRQVADTSTYNTMIKGYLNSGQEVAAKKLLGELSSLEGFETTRASYHGLLNARINAGDTRGAWSLVSDMQLSGSSPNAVTCSILLKAKTSSPAEVSKVLALADAMEQPMDEVLFMSVVEACIRTRHMDVLSKQMSKFMHETGTTILTAPTYGSLIKAFGHARDTKQVWNLWQHMISHSISPTSVTLGCMVEALVTNGCPKDAWRLAQEMVSDESTKALVNTVIYSSILKGFASSNETEKVMAAYQEMRSHNIQPNTITYNTVVNAFAQNGEMHRMPSLLEDMKAATPRVYPDIVTYSTIVKGFCNSGKLDSALGVLKDLKAEGRCTPDEVLFNSLLTGCANEGRPDDAIRLVDDMRQCGVAPSNYSLNILVKLMARCRRLDQAFALLEDIGKEYKLKINIQVYTCLIQGCFKNGKALKAIEVHEKVIKEGLHPDAMIFSVLVNGCIQAGVADKAADLARCAYGLGPEHLCSGGQPPGLNAGVLDEVMAALGGEQAKVLAAELADCRHIVAASSKAQPFQKRGPAPWLGSQGTCWQAPRIPQKASSKCM